MSQRISRDFVAAGFVSDGVDDGLALAAATLRIDQKDRASLLIPYASTMLSSTHSVPNWLEAATRWLDTDSPDDKTGIPTTLIFHVAPSGGVTFCGARCPHHNLGLTDMNLGLIVADTVIWSLPTETKDTYPVRCFRSTLDGLDEFARFRLTPDDVELEAALGPRYAARKTVAWEAGGFTYRIILDSVWVANSGQTLRQVSLETEHQDGATPGEHLVAHNAVHALLVLLTGSKCSWRTHDLRDDCFGSAPPDGKGTQLWVEVHLSATIGERSDPEPGRIRSSGYLNQTSTDALAAWCEAYKDDTYWRAVQPAVEAFRGGTALTEAMIMTLVMSLDRFGFYHFGDGQRHPLVESIGKTMDVLGFDWMTLQRGSVDDIAACLASLNNDLKHPDRNVWPEPEVLIWGCRLLQAIVRSQALHALSIDPNSFLNAEVSHLLRMGSLWGIGIIANSTEKRFRARVPTEPATAV
jgi:hypothetical protein